MIRHVRLQTRRAPARDRGALDVRARNLAVVAFAGVVSASACGPDSGTVPSGGGQGGFGGTGSGAGSQSASAGGAAGSPAPSTAERLAEGQIFHFTISGARIFWLQPDGGEQFSIRTALLDGSDARVLAEGMQAGAHCLTANGTHVYHAAAGGLLYEIGWGGSIREIRLAFGSAYNLLADETGVLVWIAGWEPTMRVENGQLQTYPVKLGFPVIQNETGLYWREELREPTRFIEERVYRLRKGSLGPAEPGPFRTDYYFEPHAFTMDGERAYGLSGKVLTGPFDPLTQFAALPGISASVGGPGPVVVAGGSLYWIGRSGSQQQVLTVPLAGGEPTALYSTDYFASALHVVDGYVYFGVKDVAGGLLRVRL